MKRFRIHILLSLLTALVPLSVAMPATASREGWRLRDSVLTVKRNVKEIPAYAFVDRDDIREVRFESRSGLRSIGEYAFMGCANLRRIALPAGLSKLGEGCFRECLRLESLTVPSSVTALPKGMCAWAEGLREVKLPAGLRDIGSHAFAYCRALTRIEIPSAVEHIGSNAFSRCSSLETVKLPARMKELESYAFSDCVSLRSAILPANSSLLGELIFSGCVSLRSITVNSPVPPPFDCDSSLFEPDETELYGSCRLIVPLSARDAYRRAPGWRLFPRIL